MKKGDALLFVDGLMHGGSSRTNPGERRITIYRYGPLWASTRFGYEYSQALLDRLTPSAARSSSRSRRCGGRPDGVQHTRADGPAEACRRIRRRIWPAGAKRAIES
jgi:hypothetical protein